MQNHLISDKRVTFRALFCEEALYVLMDFLTRL